MNIDKRLALEAAGWISGDAEDFLELTPEERHLVELAPCGQPCHP